jgi:hypothetical protein
MEYLFSRPVAEIVEESEVIDSAETTCGNVLELRKYTVSVDEYLDAAVDDRLLAIYLDQQERELYFLTFTEPAEQIVNYHGSFLTKDEAWLRYFDLSNQVKNHRCRS